MDNKRLSQIHSQVCLTPKLMSSLPYIAACSLLHLSKTHTDLHAKKQIFSKLPPTTTSPLGHRIPSAAAGALESQAAQKGGQ